MSPERSKKSARRKKPRGKQRRKISATTFRMTMHCRTSPTLNRLLRRGTQPHLRIIPRLESLQHINMSRISSLSGAKHPIPAFVAKHDSTQIPVLMLFSFSMCNRWFEIGACASIAMCLYTTILLVDNILLYGEDTMMTTRRT